MTNDRISDEVARLIDEAFDALREEQWETVRERVRAVLALDPEHEEAARLLSAAGRMIEPAAESADPPDSATSDEVGDPADPGEPTDVAAPGEADPPEPATTVPVEPTDDDLPLAPADAPPRRSAAVRIPLAILRPTGRIAWTILKPVLPPVLVLLLLVGGGLIALDRTSLWDADGPLASTGLLDADSFLVRLRIAGDDRLIWMLPFVGPDGADGTISGASTSPVRDDATVTALLDWPSAQAAESENPADLTLVVSPFRDDSTLYQFESTAGTFFVFRGTRDGDGNASEISDIEVAAGIIRTTYRFDAGRVSRVEIYNRITGQSGAVGFEYGSGTVTISAFDSPTDEVPTDRVEVDVAAHPELQELLDDLAADLRQPLSQGQLLIGHRLPSDASQPAPARQTSFEITTTVTDAVGNAVNDVDMEWELKIPSIAIGSLAEFVTGGSLDRVITSTRTGTMRRVGDGLYTAQIPLERPLTPGEQRAACDRAVGNYANAGLGLRAISGTLTLAGTAIVATGGTPPGWLGAVGIVIGAVSGLMYSPFSAAADVVRGTPRCAVVSNLAVDAFNADWTLTSRVRWSDRKWSGGGRHPDVGIATTPRSLGSANDLQTNSVAAVVDTLVLPTWLSSKAVGGNQINAVAGEIVTVRVHSTGGTPELRCRGDFTAPRSSVLGHTCSGTEPHVYVGRYRFDEPGRYLVAPEITDGVGARQRVAVTVLVSGVAEDDGAAARGASRSASGKLDFGRGVETGLLAAEAVALAAVPAEQLDQMRTLLAQARSQYLSALSATVNEISLQFSSDGGPVTGSYRLSTVFNAPTAPGAGPCSVSGTATGRLTGTYDAGAGTMSGTAEVEGSSSVDGCRGAMPPLPPPPAQKIDWSATVEGNTIRGSMVQTSGGVRVETPFQLTIGTD